MKEFDFDNPSFRWKGGVKIEGGEPDEYRPLDPTRVSQLLGPLEWMVKRTCYASKFSKVANLLAAKFVAEKRPVRMRFLAMIYESASWANEVEDRKYRFEN